MWYVADLFEVQLDDDRHGDANELSIIHRNRFLPAQIDPAVKPETDGNLLLPFEEATE